jgi:hypothetical protein
MTTSAVYVSRETQTALACIGSPQSDNVIIAPVIRPAINAPSPRV